MTISLMIIITIIVIVIIVSQVISFPFLPCLALSFLSFGCGSSTATKQKVEACGSL